MHADPDALVELDFLRIIFVSIERIETDIVVNKLSANLNGGGGQNMTGSARTREYDLLLEGFTLGHSQRVGLCDDRHNVDDLAEFFHDDDIDGPKTVTSGIDKEQAAVDARVLDVSVTHCGQFLAQIRAMLVLKKWG